VLIPVASVIAWKNPCAPVSTVCAKPKLLVDALACAR
jgi:hypothetical protein